MQRRWLNRWMDGWMDRWVGRWLKITVNLYGMWCGGQYPNTLYIYVHSLQWKEQKKCSLRYVYTHPHMSSGKSKSSSSSSISGRKIDTTTTRNKKEENSHCPKCSFRFIHISLVKEEARWKTLNNNTKICKLNSKPNRITHINI